MTPMVPNRLGNAKPATTGSRPGPGARPSSASAKASTVASSSAGSRPASTSRKLQSAKAASPKAKVSFANDKRRVVSALPTGSVLSARGAGKSNAEHVTTGPLARTAKSAPALHPKELSSVSRPKTYFQRTLDEVSLRSSSAGPDAEHAVDLSPQSASVTGPLYSTDAPIANETQGNGSIGPDILRSLSEMKMTLQNLEEESEQMKAFRIASEQGNTTAAKPADILRQTAATLQLSNLKDVTEALAQVRQHLTEAKTGAVQLELKRKQAAVARTNAPTPVGADQDMFHQKEKYKQLWCEMKEECRSLQEKFLQVEEERNRLAKINKDLQEKLDAKSGQPDVPPAQVENTTDAPVAQRLSDGAKIAQALKSFESKFGVHVMPTVTGKYEVAGNRVSVRLVNDQLVARRSGKYVDLQEYVTPR